MKQFELTKAEREGVTWKRIAAHLTEKQDEYIKQLVGSPSHDDSNVLRGKIRELKRILKLGQPPDGAGAE